MNLTLALLLGAVAACAAVPVQHGQPAGVDKLEEVFAWNQLTYNIDGKAITTNRWSPPEYQNTYSAWVFPEDSVEVEEQYTNNLNAPPYSSRGGEQQDNTFFVQYDNIPMGVDHWKDKVFITVPRRRRGIPSTLNYVSLSQDRKTKSPGLRPYPDLTSNSLGGSQGLVSVYRTSVDECDRLWVMDTGVLEIPGNFTIVQPPAIVIFDLKTDKIVRRYELGKDDYPNSGATGFASITVDVSKNSCGSAFAYLPDLLNYGMVVYSLAENKSWRVNHNFFHLNPEEGDFNLAGVKFQWNDGVFSIALGPVQSDGFRTAYFHAMASWKERAVSTAILRNKTLATRSYHESDFETLGDRGPNTQTTMHAVHQSTRVMFSAQVARSALACWNTRKPLNKNNMGIIAQDEKLFLYPSDLKIDSQDNIWIMSNKLPLWIYSKLDTTIDNFRIYKVKVQDAIRGTVCA